VSFDDAVAFCAWLTAQEEAAGRLPPGYEYRLPAECEWEYACRASQSTRWYWSEREEDAFDHCWFSENSAAPQVVGLTAPNQWGLYDMSGNVWEWCLDWYTTDTYSRVLPGGVVYKGLERNYRVLRGGSWRNSLRALRSANRFYAPTWKKADNIGFRVVCAPRLLGMAKNQEVPDDDDEDDRL
jgi:formylglycine-generating enzyme required for sulfatase activity